jgi:hypothetical protein
MLTGMLTDESSGKTGSFTLSLDTWAVLFALALALAVRLNVLIRIPW